MKTVPPSEVLFKTLKAENEAWLGDVFVPPPVFERLASDHSVILYGEPGSGKTAARLGLMKRSPNVFTPLWKPEPIMETPATGTALAAQSMGRVLRACVEALIWEAGLPKRLNEPPGFIASALQWFLKTCLPYDPLAYLQNQPGRLDGDEMKWYEKLLAENQPSVITEQTGLKDRMQLLLSIVRHAKYDGLWVMADELERWDALRAGEQVEAQLDAILSTLVLLDVPGIAFKLFLPSSLRKVVGKTSGVSRRRAAEVDLEWTAGDLKTMLERRASYALSSSVTLRSLCDENLFDGWLREYGGSAPRDWLRFTAPLIAEFQKQGKRLSADQTRAFILRHPAPLRLGRDRREVWLGKKCIPIGSAYEFRILDYLASHPGKIGSLEELYYYAQAELESVPDSGEPKWVPRKTWRAAMDTMIWRLRQKTEPNPGEPLYLVTHHGKGLELLHVEA